MLCKCGLQAEPFFAKYAELIVNSNFYRVFVDNVPEACLFYVDEPGLTEERKFILRIAHKCLLGINKFVKHNLLRRKDSTMLFKF